MSNGPPVQKVDKRLLYVVALASPIVASVGTATCEYITTHKPESEATKPEYELWSPVLNQNNEAVIVFRIDKVSGKTWEFYSIADHGTNRLQWVPIGESQ